MYTASAVQMNVPRFALRGAEIRIYVQLQEVQLFHGVICT
jgi:hypothetical protein